jgi:hypothetical protein
MKSVLHSIFLLAFLISLPTLSLTAQSGCTDQTACNFDFMAQSDDGSCEFCSCFIKSLIFEYVIDVYYDEVSAELWQDGELLQVLMYGHDADNIDDMEFDPNAVSTDNNGNDGFTFQQPISLATGDYYIRLYDFLGDGWISPGVVGSLLVSDTFGTFLGEGVWVSSDDNSSFFLEFSFTVDCNDVCGVPNGDNSTCDDCCGVPYGDGSSCDGACGPCNEDLPEGDCDCDGNVLDECGVCGGAGIADGACDCNGNVLDACGTCGGSGIPEGECDCDGNTLDYCGICAGDASTCECELDMSFVGMPFLDEGPFGVILIFDPSGQVLFTCDLLTSPPSFDENPMSNQTVFWEIYQCNIGVIVKIDDEVVFSMGLTFIDGVFYDEALSPIFSASNECLDCAGVINGDSFEDNCGVCDNDATNDCTQDCNSEWGGSAGPDMSFVGQTFENRIINSQIMTFMESGEILFGCDLSNDISHFNFPSDTSISWELREDTEYCTAITILLSSPCYQDYIEITYDGTNIGEDYCMGVVLPPIAQQGKGFGCFSPIDCVDCAGVPYGDSYEDNCGVCDDDATNDCTQDCNGNWGSAPDMTFIGQTFQNLNDEDFIITFTESGEILFGCDLSVDNNPFYFSDDTVLSWVTHSEDCHRFYIQITSPCYQDYIEITYDGTNIGEDYCMDDFLPPIAQQGMGFGCFSPIAPIDCVDCAGVPYGDSYEDNCGVCDDDDANDCTQDCNGDWGGDVTSNEIDMTFVGQTFQNLNDEDIIITFTESGQIRFGCDFSVVYQPEDLQNYPPNFSMTWDWQLTNCNIEVTQIESYTEFGYPTSDEYISNFVINGDLSEPQWCIDDGQLMSPGVGGGCFSLYNECPIYVEVLTPNGGEFYEHGDVMHITWIGGFPTTGTGLGLVKNGVHLYDIVGDLDLGTSYDWVIPESVEYGYDYQIRVYDAGPDEDMDFSDNYFSIVRYGCFDPGACNYDDEATDNDESCQYDIDLGEDITTCIPSNLQTFLLDAGEGYDVYLWNTGETTQTIVVSETGDFSVEASIAGCSHSDEITVTFNSESMAFIDVAACNSYDWNGSTYTESGNYTYMTSETINGCDSTIVMNLTLLPCDAVSMYCGEGTVWDEAAQVCVVAIPTDTNFDGCTNLDDLLDILSAYGTCVSP